MVGRLKSKCKNPEAATVLKMQETSGILMWQRKVEEEDKKTI